MPLAKSVERRAVADGLEAAIDAVVDHVDAVGGDAEDPDEVSPGGLGNRYQAGRATSAEARHALKVETIRPIERAWENVEAQVVKGHDRMAQADEWSDIG